ncbi:hypothetical protein [Cupriavidus metallidurans]|uniref:hypothetical protein n=1 Tax=Cupriavidus metallidurans TaxID=119219 RepID=UPI001CC9781E|nr:hypothetical protein [Cupriavidus metallidurans]UBM11616.1 hypothetical protein LAI70_14815 [Cupriavidus metallidurans]
MKAAFDFTLLARSILAGGAFLFGTGSNAEEITLCRPYEEVYFSCQIDEKILSVCACGNVSPDNGYVQYRFGKSDKVELEYPEKSYPPRSRFSISDIWGGTWPSRI